MRKITAEQLTRLDNILKCRMMKEIIKGNVKYVEFNQLDKRQIDRLTNGGVEMKPIIFSTLMVQAILDGRKTQTRRVINPSRKQINFMGDMDIRSLVRPDESTEEWLQLRSENGSPVTCIKVPYQPGDILWVRETWRDRWGMAYANYGTGNAYPIDDVREIEYKAGGNGFFMHGCNLCPDEPTVKWGEWSKWRSPRFMPKEAARIFLLVTNVRVERVQDITAHDAIREGMESEIPFDTVDEFKELWNNLNAKRGYGWDTNPWVWVVKFERISKDEAYKKEG